MADKTIVITRFDPDKDQAPRKQEYKVPCESNWKVLDAINFIKDESGPTAVEYAVMLALIVVVCITAITTLGTNANNTFSYVGNKIAGSGS